jgi:hypothetical protein
MLTSTLSLSSFAGIKASYEPSGVLAVANQNKIPFSRATTHPNAEYRILERASYQGVEYFRLASFKCFKWPTTRSLCLLQ